MLHTTGANPVQYHRYKGYVYTNPDFEKLNYFVDKVDALDYHGWKMMQFLKVFKVNPEQFRILYHTYFYEDYLDRMSDIWKDMIYSWKDLQLKQADQHLSTPQADRLPKFDELQPKVGYEDIEELKDAPLSVRRQFSATYGNRSDKTAVWKKQLVDSVRKNKLDGPRLKDQSLEAKIAYLTVQIRQWQALIDHFATLTSMVPTKLTELVRLTVDKRRRYLGYLRKADYQSFDNLIKQLKIAYQVPLQPEDRPINIRKQWMLHHLERRVAIEKERQMSELAARYEEARPKFEVFMKERFAELDEKEEKLKKRLTEINSARGKYTGKIDGEFQTNTVGEADEKAVNIYWYMNLDAQRERMAAQ